MNFFVIQFVLSILNWITISSTDSTFLLIFSLVRNCKKDVYSILHFMKCLNAIFLLKSFCKIPKSIQLIREFTSILNPPTMSSSSNFGSSNFLEILTLILVLLPKKFLLFWNVISKTRSSIGSAFRFDYWIDPTLIFAEKFLFIFCILDQS